ncbi:hypothetical protein ACLMJK_007185 [Lecanora helva]
MPPISSFVSQLCRLSNNRIARPLSHLRSSPYTTVLSPRPYRYFTASGLRFSSQDHSTIDFAYMPQFELEEPRQSEVLRAPLLPSQSSASSHVHEAPEPVTRPEIATVSANGTHIDNPSAMSEVTDNHAVELSPFNLTGQVSNAATAAASKMTGVSEARLKEQGVLQKVWSGFLDDVLGGKKAAKA